MKKILLNLLFATLSSGFIYAQNAETGVLNHFPKTEATFTNNTSKATFGNELSGSSSTAEKCGQKEREEALKASNPQYAVGLESAREMTNNIIREIENGTRATPPVYTIPVVFHVIHKGESVGSGTNISSAQIQSSIDALNRDYRRTSANGGIAQGAGPDTEVQFCLAGVDPSGSPHTGINRVNGTSVSGYSGSGITSSNEANIKALSRWDNRYYLNIWVVSEINNNGADVSNPANFSGGTLGYAYLPTNPVTWNSDLDGIVAINLCVGNDPNQTEGYRLWPWASLTNRTITHEVGHYLNLNHTFEGGSCSESNCSTQGDGVCDTPPTVQNSGCSSSCPNAQVENYMDYTDETCQDMFSAGQSTRIRAALSGVRNALVTTNNCGVSTDYDAGISAISTPNGSLCQTTFTPVVTLNNYASTALTSVQIQYYVDANGPSTYNWTGNLGSNSSTNVTLGSLTTTTGSHSFTATTVSGTLNTNNTDQDTNNDDATSSFSVSSGGNSITLTLDLDCYGEETTWEIRNASNQLESSGGPYVNNANGEQIIESLCLAEGCYDFIIFDTYADGMYGSQYQDCSIDGNYTITDGSSTLVQMTAPNADFGASATHNFCIGGGGSIVCGDLMEFDGSGYLINNNDFPSFGAEYIDGDQQAVATTLADANYTSNWMGFYEVPNPGDTNSFVRVTSWFLNTTVPADNWLTFGPITIPSEGGELTWDHRFPDNNNRDGYSVLLNYSGTSVANFSGATTLFSVADNAASTDGNTDWTSQLVDLPSATYAGQSVYIGFHHTALNLFLLDLDNIKMEGCESITVDVSETETFKMNVFPNPSTGNFSFQYEGSKQDLDFSMFNTVGQVVWDYQSIERSNGLQTINTSGLNAGVYTLVVKGERLNVSQRLILLK